MRPHPPFRLRQVSRFCWMGIYRRLSIGAVCSDSVDALSVFSFYLFTFAGIVTHKTVIMKNLSLWFLFLFLALTAVSCEEKPRYVIGVSQCSDDEWRNQQNSEMLREAGLYPGLELKFRAAKDDNAKQIADIRAFIREGVDLLVVAPNQATPVTPVVEEAYDKGIPVIIVDRKIYSDKYTAYVGADNRSIGLAVGRYIGNCLGGKGNVVEIMGLAGSTPAIERDRGFMEALSAYPDIRLLAVEEGAFLRSQAEAMMDSLLSRFPHIDAVYAQNDRMAAGAYDAAVRRNREKEILFFGTDALPGSGNGVESVLAGRMTASFIYPTGGGKVIQTAMRILTGQPFERENGLSTSVVDSTNAPIMKLQTAHIANLDQKIETLNGRVTIYLNRYDTQQVVLTVSLVAMALIVGLLVLVCLSLRDKNRLNRELSGQKAILEEQYKRLKEQTLLLETQKSQLEAQKSQLEVQKNQLERLAHELEQATHAKLVFFTNVSHDFRTPLTLIADPVERLLANPSIDGQGRQLLILMRKNVCILLRLVNQILDFRKVENGRMELRLEPFDLQANFLSWNDAFRMAMLKKHIAFHFEATPEADFRTMADAEKMERIYFNLLSNAVKYTPENGRIAVSLQALEESYRLTVANTGSYISPAEAEAIFDRFYQVSGHQAGTGIGLALVKAFVEMQGGSITAGSDEKGTVFTVLLPKREIVPGEADPKELSEVDEEVASSLSDAALLSEEVLPEDMDAPIVLVIDDNADIRFYIKSLLSKDYRVLLAADGTTGIRLAMKFVPDVVVSDVMMPGMDGVECCRRLKSEMQTCHIPVILLTACSLDEQRIQGYDGGADSYISKPFNSQLLLSRIRNLIAGRQRLKQVFGDNRSLEKESIHSLDKDFVSRFRTLVEEKLGNPALNVEDLGREMGMSRVQLYRKLKSLTNYSPNELLRQMRLKKAASLLASSDLTVAEVAYEVGFSSPSYFTKCYKEQFGEIPTSLLKRKEGREGV